MFEDTQECLLGGILRLHVIAEHTTTAGIDERPVQTVETAKVMFGHARATARRVALERPARRHGVAALSSTARWLWRRPLRPFCDGPCNGPISHDVPGRPSARPPRVEVAARRDLGRERRPPSCDGARRMKDFCTRCTAVRFTSCRRCAEKEMPNGSNRPMAKLPGPAAGARAGRRLLWP